MNTRSQHIVSVQPNHVLHGILQISMYSGLVLYIVLYLVIPQCVAQRWLLMCMS